MRTLTIIFLLFFANSGFGQQYQRFIVDTLASDYFSGRGYVNDGADKSADFIKKQFRYLKLDPVNDKYFQSVPMQVNTFPGTLTLEVDGKKLTPGIDYLVDPISGGGSADLKVEKINVFNKSQMQKLMNSKKYINKVLLIEKPDTLSNVGIGEFNSLVRALGDVWPIFVLTTEKLTWSVGNTATKFPIFWVNSNDVEKVKTVKYVVEQKLVNIESNNVMAMVRGKKGNDRFLLVTAHYDHLGMMGNETIFPGANDNASGVAEMLSLAAYFSKNPLDKSILFVAFTGEEVGLLGSKHFVNNPIVPLDSIDFVLNLDLSGTGDEGITVVNATQYIDVFNKLVELNNEGGFIPKVNKRGPAANSDHFFFVENNVPAFFIYTLGGIKAYHDVYDVSETLPLTEAKDLQQLYIQFFEYLDGIDRPIKSD